LENNENTEDILCRNFSWYCFESERQFKN